MNIQEKLTNAILEKKKEMDHLTYILEKEEKTVKLFDEQMFRGKVFKTSFEKIDGLKENISDV